jgi:hypothetical protein
MLGAVCQECNRTCSLPVDDGGNAVGTCGCRSKFPAARGRDVAMAALALIAVVMTTLGMLGWVCILRDLFQRCQ